MVDSLNEVTVRSGNLAVGQARWVAIALALACGLSSSTARAGAWTEDAEHFYIQLGSAFTFANSRFDLHGNSQSILVKRNAADSRVATKNVSNFQQLYSDLYIEYGLLDRLTLFSDVAYTSARQKNDTDQMGASNPGDIQYSSSGIGDTMVGARIGLVKDPFAAAIEARLTLPTADSQTIIPNGPGDLRSELRLAAGKTLPWLPITIDGEFGFTFRGTGVLNDPSKMNGTLSVDFAPELVLHGDVTAALVRWQGANRLLLTFAVDYRTSTKHTFDAQEAFQTIAPEDSEYTTIGGALTWFVYHGIGILGRVTYAVEGKRLPQGTTVGGALFVAR